ncbi:MAG: cell division protein FtsA [Lentisphaeria bacterium]|nr:cell division protein FtsA [Lentisphaeria bacterium]
MGNTMQALVTVIEFGSDKIRVLHGCRDEAGEAQAVAFAEESSEGAVVKGMIVDPEKAEKILGRVIDRADRAVSFSGDRRFVLFLLNGAAVVPCRGEGSVSIHDSEKVESRHVEDALKKAHSVTLQPGIVSFNSFDGFFVLDRSSRVKQPLGQCAKQLDAYLHILTTEQRVLDQINNMLFRVGFELKGEPLFNGIASAYGVLRQEEQEQGVLLIDFGHGACDYVLVCTEGIYHSGVLPVGVAHVANDLAIGLDLPYEFCLKFLREDRLRKMRESGMTYLEYTVSATGKKRQVPLYSFEKIIGLRLREIYSVIQAKVYEKNLKSCISAGVVICGGGSQVFGSLEAAKQIFSDSSVRIGEPMVTGSKAGFELPMPCYASLLGGLKYALEDDALNEGSSIDAVRNVLSSVGENVLNKVKKVFGK